MLVLFHSNAFSSDSSRGTLAQSRFTRLLHAWVRYLATYVEMGRTGAIP